MDSDLVICCTGAAETVVSLADVAAAVSRRPGRPLVVLGWSLGAVVLAVAFILCVAWLVFGGTS